MVILIITGKAINNRNSDGDENDSIDDTYDDNDDDVEE